MLAGIPQRARVYAARACRPQAAPSSPRRAQDRRASRCQARLLDQDAQRPRRFWRTEIRRPWPRQGARAPDVQRRRSQRIHRQQNSKGNAVSLYRRPRSPYWHFDFYWRGHRFHGTTKATNKREAEKIEAAERERARGLVAQIDQAKTSLRLHDIASRYWTEHAQHLAGAPNTWTLLGILIEYFGKDMLITDVRDDDVAKLVAWRRGHRGRKDVAATTFISPHTVNHTTTTLRKLFTRCKLWDVRFAHEPKWTKQLLKVPTERVRELSDDEADRLDEAMRTDYVPFFDFAHATGWRLAECLLKWDEVNFTTGQIIRLGKGGKRLTRRITSDLYAILWPLRGHHPVFVFTFVSARGNHGRVKGHRYPL